MKQKELDELIEAIRPKSEEQIIRRIKQGSFAKVIIWACVNSRDTDFLCVRDLAKFMRVSLQRARYILEDMVKFELMMRNKISGCSVDYYFAIDDYTGKPRVFNYFDIARESLGIKLRPEEIKAKRNI